MSLRVALPGRVVIQVPIDDERSMARVKQAQAGAIRRIADQLGVHPETLRGWAKRAETDAGDRPGTTSSDADRIAALERENRELRRANQILKSAASFFAAELCAT